jgi:hypothetical protein
MLNTYRRQSWDRKLFRMHIQRNTAKVAAFAECAVREHVTEDALRGRWAELGGRCAYVVSKGKYGVSPKVR